MRFISLIIWALVGLGPGLPSYANATDGCNCREVAASAVGKVEMAPRTPELSPDERGDAKRPGYTKRVKIAISGMT
jgi:hypothetical protein